MTTQLKHVENLIGRVLVGPKKLRNSYVRIVSHKDGEGRIEKFDPASRTWGEAPASISFGEIWSAPAADPLLRAIPGAGRS